MSSTANRVPDRRHLAGAVLRIERVIAVALLVLVLGLTFAQVLARFVFDSPFFWTEELARYGYVWLTFIASMAAMADRSHIAVQLGESRLPASARLALNTGAMGLVVLACLALLVGSWPWLNRDTAGASAALQIPNVVFYAVVWAAFAAIAAHALVQIVSLVREHRRNGGGATQRGGSTL